MSGTAFDPIIVNAFPQVPSSGRRILERKRLTGAQKQKKEESDLLKSIRAAFQGSGKEPEPPIHSVISASVDGPHGEEELAWDERTVVWCIGGVLRNTWSFSEEDQRVQYACFGWLHTEGTVRTKSGRARHTTNDTESDDDEPFPLLKSRESKDERDTFGPFFRARKAQMRTVEPPTIARAVFIFLRNFGRIYLMNGTEYSFSLPFIVHRAWSLSPHGVLLQRVVDPAELNEPDPLPSLYTLTNPFQEPRPVGLASHIKTLNGRRNQNTSVIEESTDRSAHSSLAGEEVVWIAPKICDVINSDHLLATVNHEQKTLSFWRYALVSPSDSTQGISSPVFPHQQNIATGDKQLSQSRHSGNDMASRGDRIRAPSPEFEPSQPSSMAEMGLRPFQSMPPPLTSTSTLASMSSGGSSGLQHWVQGADPKGRRSSLSRNELSMTMNRMALDRKSDAHAHGSLPAIRESIIPAYWIQKLYEYELADADLSDWKNLTFGVYDRRSDGKRDRCLVAFCLPASQQCIQLIMTTSANDAFELSFNSSKQDIRSVASVRAIRDQIADLVSLRSNHTLFITTFEGVDVEIDVALHAYTPQKSPGDVEMISAAEMAKTPTITKSKILAIKDCVASNLTLMLEGGDSIRASLNLIPPSRLVCSMKVVLASNLKHDHFPRIWVKFLQLWNRKHFSYHANVQFDCLARAILAHWGMAWLSAENPVPSAQSSPWMDMLQSSQHFKLRDDPILASITPSTTPPPPLRVFRELSKSEKNSLHVLLSALHILGEELRLLTFEHQSLLRLSTLTVRLAQVIRPGFFDLLKRVYPSSSNGWQTGIDMNSKGEVMLPIDFHAMLYSRLAQPESTASSLDSALSRPILSYALGGADPHPIMRLFKNLFDTLSDHTQPSMRKRAEATVLMMANDQIEKDFFNMLPLSIGIPLREAARTCQLGPPSEWPAIAYEFVGRNDLTESGKTNGDFMFNDGYRTVKDHLKVGVPRRTFGALFDEAHRAVYQVEEAGSGVELEITNFTDVRFGQDRRLHEVARMLRSSNIPSIRMPERPDLNDHDMAKEQAIQVLRTAERTLALPLGRALFTFATVSSVTRETYAIPKIELAIRLLPQGITVSPELGKIPNDALIWAEFHNGVAAALRISPSTSAIDSSWISFNKPTELTSQHAGFLFGLGLTGHLKQMLTWHTFGYLTPKHEMTSIGVLLGLSAAHVGSGNKHVTKLLAVHTPAFLPQPDVDLNVPLTTQAAGLVGIGLLYMGSKNRRMAEVALHEIGRSDLSQPDVTNESRESYTLAAALSFGMIMLGKGSSTTSPADIALLARLRVLIHGEGPQNVEGSGNLDINITSPAASLALGLMYLRTERQDVADIMTIPDSVAALNLIQPNFVLIRTIARNLIMWNTIKPTQRWAVDQIPKPIMNAMEKGELTTGVDDAVELAYYHITSGAIFALALKYAGTANQEAFAIICQFFEFFLRLSSNTNPAFNQRIKRAAARDGLSLVTLAMGIVMVGTGELNCLKRLRIAHGMWSQLPQLTRYGSHMASHMALGLLFLGEGRFSFGTSDSAIACMIAAFFPLFPILSSEYRTYLPALRHLWVLAVEPRCLIARDVDTKEVVYLPMKIRLKDALTPSGMMGYIAPTLIPSLDRILTIKIDTPRYWPFLLDVGRNSRHFNCLLQSQTLFVKRRSMFLSYMEDPKGSRSLFVRSGMATGDAATLDCPQLTDTSSHPASDIQHYITSHSNDISFLAFADRLCRADGQTPNEQIFNNFCHATLLDCIMQDKPQMLSSYLALYRARNLDPRSRFFQLVMQDLVHTSEFYSRLWERRYSGRPDGIVRPSLLRENAVSGVVAAMDKKLQVVKQKPAFKAALHAYVTNRSPNLVKMSLEARVEIERELAWYLQRHAVPYAPYFRIVQQLSIEMLAEHRPRIAADMDPSKVSELEQAVKLTLHSSLANLVRPFGLWTIESFNDMIQSWADN